MLEDSRKKFVWNKRNAAWLTCVGWKELGLLNYVEAQFSRGTSTLASFNLRSHLVHLKACIVEERKRKRKKTGSKGGETHLQNLE
jgi:hypothetical protein